MSATTTELAWAIILGAVVFLSLVFGLVAILLSSQRRLIAAQREKMTALKKSEEQYSDLFNNVTDLIYIHDLEGTIFQVNEAANDLLGYPRDLLLHRSLKDLLPREDQNKFDSYLEAIQSKDASAGILRLKNKSGDLRIVEYRNSLIRQDGRAVAVRGIARNITAEYSARKALAQSEERFRRLVNYSPVPMAVHISGRIVFITQAGIRLLGASHLDAVIGKSIFSFVSQDQRNYLRHRLRESRKVGLESTVLDAVIQCPDGRQSDIEIVGIPIVYDGRPAGQLVIRDVTEKKRLHEELARAQRLETAGRVSGQIAHDFNNLLAPLTAFPTLIREDLPIGHSAVELVDEMEDAAEKIAEINQQLLALGRRGHYALEPVLVNHLLLHLTSSIKIPAEVVVNQELAPDLPLIRGGSAQLTRAFSNLVTNALEAMNGIGILTIRSQRMKTMIPITGYQTVDPGDYILVQITDTGTGIDNALIDRIFDPFYTTKKMDRMRGSGLGLSIVQGVMEDHHGSIIVESAVGGGTTFSLYFPTAEELEQPQDDDREIAYGDGEKVLIVDDDEVQRRVAGHLIERLGYKVRLAENGPTGIAIASNEPQDLLILDMRLEGMDGTEIYKRILEIYPNQKAILLSGYAKSSRVKEALDLGAGMFLAKPVSPYNLARAIRKELDKPRKSPIQKQHVEQIQSGNEGASG